MKRLFCLVVVAGASIAACNNNETTPTPVVASVTVRPAADSVPWGDLMLVLRTAHLAAVLKDAGGNVLSVIQTGQSVVWTSSDSTVATVNRYGIVRGLARGSVTITAAIEGKSASSAVQVDTLVTVAAVSVKPTPDSVAVGKTVQLKATPTRANGDTLTANYMFWASSDTSVAIVSNNDTLGVSPGNTASIKGVKAGSVTITATIAGVSGTGAMKVKP